MFSPKNFLCVAVAFFGFATAVRRGFQLDRSAINAVEGVSSLIQKQVAPAGVQSAMQILQKAQRIVSKITPGAKEAMDVALRGVISEIQQNVETKIKLDHDATQVAIDAAKIGLKTTTDAAVQAKTVADVADNTFVTCRGVEQEKLEAVESAQTALDAANQARIQPCADQDAAAPFNKEFSESDLVFDCDISLTSNCDAQLADFERRIEALLTSLETDVSASTEVYTAAKNRCDAAKAAIVAAEQAELQAVGVFQAQKEQCMSDHEARQVSICMFGMDLSAKCEKKKEFQELDAQIDGSGSVHSDSDRQSEFEAVSITKCMLQLIVDSESLADVNINEESLATCVAAVNFGEDVGVLTRRTRAFAELTAPETFTCSETQIPFSGFTWIVPEATKGAVVTSEQYEKIEFSVPVSAEGETKFAFCASDGQTCGFFQCDFGKVIDPSRTCSLSSGCTNSECCA